MGERSNHEIQLAPGACSVLEALVTLIDVLEPPEPEPCDQLSVDPRILPMSTGRVYLDRVLGGGLRAGTVTLVEAGHAHDTRPLLVDLALHAPHHVLFAGGHALELTAVLLAAAARVPTAEFSRAELTEESWSRVANTIGQFADRDIWVTERRSAAGLRVDIHSADADVLVIDDLARIGEPSTALRTMRQLAAETTTAVVAGCGPLGEDGLSSHPSVVRVAFEEGDLPGRNVLVRADESDLLRVEDVLVDPVTEALN